MPVIEAQRASITEPHDHRHISQIRGPADHRLYVQWRTDHSARCDIGWSPWRPKLPTISAGVCACRHSRIDDALCSCDDFGPLCRIDVGLSLAGPAAGLCIRFARGACLAGRRLIAARGDQPGAARVRGMLASPAGRCTAISPPSRNPADRPRLSPLQKLPGSYQPGRRLAGSRPMA